MGLSRNQLLTDVCSTTKRAHYLQTLFNAKMCSAALKVMHKVGYLAVFTRIFDIATDLFNAMLITLNHKVNHFRIWLYWRKLMLSNRLFNKVDK